MHSYVYIRGNELVTNNYMCCSSCNYLCVGLILSPLPSLAIYFHLQCSMTCLDKDVERNKEIMRPKKEELHELPFT